MHASVERKAVEQSAACPLTGLLMPVVQVACGEDFCVALMANGLVFSWGDGEEGKLGLGQQHSHDKPAMVDALLPTAYAEAAKSATPTPTTSRPHPPKPQAPHRTSHTRMQAPDPASPRAAGRLSGVQTLRIRTSS